MVDEIEEYSAFYLESVPRLVSFLVVQGWSLEDAADCAQETMIDALPPTWATLEQPYSWCRVVAYRKACDLAVRRREMPISEPEFVGSPLITPDIDLESFETEHDLLRLLARLPGDKQRAVLVWTIDGATSAEIAAALGMNPATVRSTLRNARAAVRRLLEGDEHQ